METYNHVDYIKNAQDTHELLLDPEVSEELEPAARQEIQKVWRRAQLLRKLVQVTGYPFEVYDGVDMPNAAGFVVPGKKTVHIAEHVLDNPKFAEHVSEHEADHLRTMLVLPVDTDFTQEHFNTLARFLPVRFEENTFYLEGFNEALTRSKKGEGNRATAYDQNVRAAYHLESLAFSATGESLMNAFKQGAYDDFSRILKQATDRLMLYESLKDSEAPDTEYRHLLPSIKNCDEPVGSPQKADVMVDVFWSRLKAERMKSAIKKGDFSQWKKTEPASLDQAPSSQAEEWEPEKLAA